MRVVVKVGTSSVTDAGGAVDDDAIVKLADEIAALRVAGHEVIVVSSGAVAAGVAALGLTDRPTDVTTLQALSAAGQPRLMRSWDTALAVHGLVPAQALLVPHDFVDRRQYLHARRTLTRLLSLGAIPIINENDAIASDESRYGDNDRLAALVAHNVGAAVLVLLTDLDGLYTADPRVHADAQLVTRVRVDDPMLSISASGGGSGRGSGGMASKLEAARIASWSGVRTVIANAGRAGVVAGAIADDPVGTCFEAHRRKLTARKLWIAFASRVAGSVTVDDGARRALVERQTSLLPAGVVDITGRFGEGDTVDVVGTDGVPFARGMVFVEAAQLRKVAGRHTSDLPVGMTHEVIHRDDLVMLPG
ncbi:MAG: glutamate 5-kinase [Ilumatobacteraceae bacterium]